MTQRGSSTYGFAKADKLLQSRIRKLAESRGFAQSRILTHWQEIAGPDIAAISRPVDVRFGKGGLGATLTVLTTGANAPVLEMQKETLRARINAVYGYNAIARLRVTQTAPTGFAEGRADFVHCRPEPAPIEPGPESMARAQDATGVIADEGLRAALERLGANVISKAERRG